MNLKVEEKAFNLRLFHFKPATAGESVYAVRDIDKWLFSYTEKITEKNTAGDKSFIDCTVRCEWVTTLRRELALRVAHSVGKDVTRIGLSESQWQRRWAK